MGRKQVEANIKALGGKTSASVTAKTTHLLATSDELKKKTAKIIQAQGKDVPIVEEGFLEACKQNGSLVDESSYLLDGGGGTKRKAPAKAAPAAKKAKAATKKAPPKKAAAPAPAPASSGGGGHSVHPMCPQKGSIVSDLQVTLNQTNIGDNNNKFYIIQGVKSGSGLYLFTHWGRVGYGGQQACKPQGDVATLQKEFEKTFKTKTGNAWNDKANFVPKNKKYEIVETATAADVKQNASDNDARKQNSKDKKAKEKASTAKSKLDSQTQDLVSWILDEDMFKSQMAELDFDVNKCPLGALTKAQVKKGYAVLADLDKALKKGDTKKMETLSSSFYQLIPHAFGMRRPPVINTAEMLKAKYDLVSVLNDVEIAQGIQNAADDDDDDSHPLDKKYGQLNTDLKLVKPASKVFKTIKKYTDATMSSWRKIAIQNVWEVDREGEGARFDEHDDLDNRKLLWHGTNVAVVAAILKTGLRIMPTAASGSRVGRGIYLASENGKSAMYTRTQQMPNGETHGIMFLCEAALGNIKEITRDEWFEEDHLKKGGKLDGFDSVLAKGRTEPDEAADTTITLDKKKVVVPQGKPKQTGLTTSFGESEYLVYRESQARIRYILRVKFN
jgi:poly [ADP-ribose] polymerase